MLTIDTYLRPQSLDEAWEMAQKKNSAVLGGMLWLRLGNHRIGTAIDLSDLGLDTVEDTGDSWQIGAYTTLRTLETHAGLHETYGEIFAKTVAPIVGVQFRNLATVGGSVFGRFGFSDVLTTLLALQATVTFHKAGTMSLADFCSCGKTKDILTHVTIPKSVRAASCYAQRNTATDFPVLNTCAAVRDNTLTVTVGARPLRACPYTYTLPTTPDDTYAEAVAGDVADKCVFADNTRATAAYRKHLCRVLVRRAVNDVQKERGEWRSH